ncbi:MAG TPA: tetratricopeptide repeat protein [Armatimonadota bacterium]|nr:tetratricopeptide repeat protein [Armatimonadota bacterium]
MKFSQSRLALLLLGALGAALLIWFLIQPSAARQDYQRGADLAKVQLWPEAAAAWKQAIHSNPRFVPPYRKLADLYEQQGDETDAIKVWRDLAKRVPSAKHVLCQLSADEGAAGLQAPALNDAEKELKQDPSCPTASLVAGQILANTSLQEEALARLKVAAAAYPTNDALQLLYGRELAKNRLYDRAIPQLQAVLKRQPSSAEGIYWLAYCLSRISPPKTLAAETLLKEALSIRPDYPEAAAELGHVYQQAGQSALAIPYLKQSLVEQPHQPTALFDLAAALRTTGQKTAATAALGRFQVESALSARESELQRRYAVDRSPAEAIALARLELQMNNPQAAIRALQEVALKNPHDTKITALLRQAQSKLGE